MRAVSGLDLLPLTTIHCTKPMISDEQTSGTAVRVLLTKRLCLFDSACFSQELFTSRSANFALAFVTPDFVFLFSSCKATVHCCIRRLIH